MNPGTSIAPLASMMRVTGDASLRISALEPTALIRSPLTATASAQGRLASPVQTRALTMASCVVGTMVELVAVIVQPSVNGARRSVERRMRQVG